MDHEVARTLGELELKLRELERELAELGRHTTEPDVEQPPSAVGRLVDEAVEPPPTPPVAATPVSRALRYSMEAQETAFGEIPATRDEQASIDLAELVRFRETLQETLQDLIDQYSRLLSLRPRK